MRLSNPSGRIWGSDESWPPWRKIFLYNMVRIRAIIDSFFLTGEWASLMGRPFAVFYAGQTVEETARRFFSFLDSFLFVRRGGFALRFVSAGLLSC